MSNIEMKELELLLMKLEAHMGHPFAITFPVVHDGYSMAIYNRSTGIQLEHHSSYDLRSTIEKFQFKQQ